MISLRNGALEHRCTPVARQEGQRDAVFVLHREHQRGLAQSLSPRSREESYPSVRGSGSCKDLRCFKKMGIWWMADIVEQCTNLNQLSIGVREQSWLDFL